MLTASFAQQSTAQDLTDALRLSNLTPQGTARSIGFGNALGSIGGDFSSLSVNPAGIGVYRKSELMISPSMMFSGVEGRYNPNGTGLGNGNTENGSHFAISNFGFVFTNAARGKRYDRSNWKSTSFAIGLNRLADFTRDYSYSGTNTTTSGSWIFESDANSNPDNVFQNGRPAYLGYESYLLDTATVNGQPGYVSVVNPDANHPVGQLLNMRERGGISEFLLSWGGNYKEKLMLGATVGLPYVRYKRESTYQETDLSNDNNNDFKEYIYTDNLRTTGLGINAKFGFIYKPVEILRLGAAIHTPTWYSLRDRQTRSLFANTENFAGERLIDAPENDFNYNISTPWRAVGSASVLFGKYGFFTADVEYVDYKSSRIRFDEGFDLEERFANQEIKDAYTSAINVRGGVEVKLDIISLRVGLGYYGSPYKNFKDGDRMDYSAGIGFRMNHSFIDFGFVHRQYSNEENPYTSPYSGYISPVARLNTNQNNAVLTFGWKF